MPMTEHSAEILAGSWPSQSVMAWSGYGMAYAQQANSLFTQLDAQMDIKEALAGMDGAFIDSARELVNGRETALQNRIAAYRHIANKAHWAASELQSTKTDLSDIVNAAENKIKVSRDNAEKAKSAATAIPGAVAAIEADLRLAIQGIVATAKADAQRRDLQGATTVTALSNDVAQWSAPYINSMLPEAGAPSDLGNLPAAPPTGVPRAPQNGSGQTRPVDERTFKDSPLDRQPQSEQAPESSQQRREKNFQQTEMRNDRDVARDAANGHPKPSNPSPASSAPSSPASSGGSGGSPASSIGQMMRPASSGSSSPSSSSSGAASPANAAQSSQFANAKPGAVPGTGANAAAGAGSLGRASGLASLGSGVAESSARLVSGAVSTASNAVSGAANVGSNVAQNVAQAAAQAPAAAGSMPAAAVPAGGAGMGMMPAAAAAGGPAVVNPVSGTSAGTPAVGGGPSTTPATGPAPVSSAGGLTSQAASGGSLAPVAVQGPGVRGVGADGASGDVLFQQAMDAGRDVISAMVAQSVGVGYIEIHYAVALVYERGGTVSAWMATSEGASYVPLGVRVPQAVQLSVTDPVVGHELWEMSSAAGGGSPLEIVVRQAAAREMAAPGGRVLAVASSLPMGQVIDWAGEVGARPVSVDPKAITAAAAPDMAMVHRCAVAMPWEWRQANAFSEQDRLKVAARHMHMASTAGHLSSGACEEVIELFESRTPIDEARWRDVDRARFMSLIEYEMAMRSAGQGGAEPARALASARAAEVVLCLRNYATAEGCADLLYASRLAGAPLNPAAAVA